MTADIPRPPRRVLVDTNVVLDVLLEREPWVEASARLFGAVATGQVTGVLAAHAVTTAYYVYQQGRGREAGLAGLERLLRLFDVAAVGRVELMGALSSGFSDYEDGVVHEAAVTSQCEGIVTRNGPDFAGSVLPVYSPGELLAVLTAAG